MSVCRIGVPWMAYNTFTVGYVWVWSYSKEEGKFTLLWFISTSSPSLQLKPTVQILFVLSSACNHIDLLKCKVRVCARCIYARVSKRNKQGRSSESMQECVVIFTSSSYWTITAERVCGWWHTESASPLQICGLTPTVYLELQYTNHRQSCWLLTGCASMHN